MSIKPPLTDLPIGIAESGFYRGFTKDVTITAKILVGALILWAFVILCFGLALWPRAGRMKLGHLEDEPELSNFASFSMMFGADITG
ncbi:MAG: hypothetical protein V2J20_04950 [Wenzhouxiangella sp.]|jgi:choline-glycine betaine transporter|nr:hypothetical protein [Wenzhouxiangella sp.]